MPLVSPLQNRWVQLLQEDLQQQGHGLGVVRGQLVDVPLVAVRSPAGVLHSQVENVQEAAHPSVDRIDLVEGHSLDGRAAWAHDLDVHIPMEVHALGGQSVGLSMIFRPAFAPG